MAAKDGKIQALDSIEFMKSMGCWYNRTQQLSVDYFQCMLSSILDDEGRELLANSEKRKLTRDFLESKEEERLAIAYAGDAVG